MTLLTEIKQINAQYFDWLKDNTVVRSLADGWTEITTPLLDRHNDSLQIYAKIENDTIHLTDDGYTIDDLRMSGCDIDSTKRKAILNEMLAGFGIKLLDGRLEVMGDKRNFSQFKLNLIQAMLSVSDMFYLSSSHVLSLFSEDTASWLNSSGIRYSPDIWIRGKSGFIYRFFGLIPKSQHSPERFIQPVNQPDKSAIQKLIFEWDEAKATRDGDPLFIPILNDMKKRIRSEFVNALEVYGIKYILWSERERCKDLLAL